MEALFQFFQFDFVIRALIGGTILAMTSAVLGCFVVLRRMSFFTDAIAHASLTGVALALIFTLDPTVGAIIFSIFIGLLLSRLDRKKVLSSDTIIGVLFTSSIALAVIIIRLLPGVQYDLNSLLFGDILTVTTYEVILSLILMILVLLFTKKYVKPMLKLIFQKDLAQVEHKGLIIMDYLFLTLLALIISVSLKMIGAILVSALIIIPAATAQNIARNVRYMFFLSVVFAMLTVVIGMFASFLLETPSGATIVVVQAMVFLLSSMFKNS